MTETQTPDTTINDLQKAVREAGSEERRLALEVGELHSRIKDAARQDARRQARAAREGGAGKEVAEAAQESEIPALRERLSSLPHLRWAAGIRTASLQVELHDEQIAENERKAEIAKTGLPGLKASAAEASRAYEEKASAYRKAVGGKDALISRRTVFVRELRLFEESMPDA